MRSDTMLTLSKSIWVSCTPVLVVAVLIIVTCERFVTSITNETRTVMLFFHDPVTRKDLNILARSVHTLKQRHDAHEHVDVNPLRFDTISYRDQYDKHKQFSCEHPTSAVKTY